MTSEVPVYNGVWYAMRWNSNLYADVMELADVTDSKSVDGDIVWVRVPPSAPCRISCNINEVQLLLGFDTTYVEYSLVAHPYNEYSMARYDSVGQVPKGHGNISKWCTQLD